MSNEIVYTKVCVHCKKSYTSTSRGQRFCSSECQQKHAKKVSHQREVTAKQGDSSKIVSRAYSLCQAVGELYCPKPDDYYQNRSKYRWHHIDGCVLNNSPFNIICVEHTVHEKLHSHLSKINSTEVLRVLLEHPELLTEAQSTYISTVLSEGKHDEVLNSDFLSVVNRYRVQSYLTERENAFSNLDLLKTEFMLFPMKDFAMKWFRVRTQTEVSKIFRDAGYSSLFAEWIKQKKAGEL